MDLSALRPSREGDPLVRQLALVREVLARALGIRRREAETGGGSGRGASSCPGPPRDAGASRPVITRASVAAPPGPPTADHRPAPPTPAAVFARGGRRSSSACLNERQSEQASCLRE